MQLQKKTNFCINFVFCPYRFKLFCYVTIRIFLLLWKLYNVMLEKINTVGSRFIYPSAGWLLKWPHSKLKPDPSAILCVHRHWEGNSMLIDRRNLQSQIRGGHSAFTSLMTRWFQFRLRSVYKDFFAIQQEKEILPK